MIRRRHVEAEVKCQELEVIVKRMQQISQCPRIIASGPRVRQRIRSMKDDLGRLIRALQEMVTAWKQYLEEFPEVGLLPLSLQEVESTLSSSQMVADDLAKAVLSVNALKTPVILEGEPHFLELCTSHSNPPLFQRRGRSHSAHSGPCPYRRTASVALGRRTKRRCSLCAPSHRVAQAA